MQITVETLIHAPVAKVWAAYTTQSTVDLREGGAFSSRMEAKDGSFGFDFAGTYTRIVPNQRIEYAFGDRSGTVEFIEGADGVTVRSTFEAESEHPVEQQRFGWLAIHFEQVRPTRGNLQMTKSYLKALCAALALAVSGSAMAAPISYTIDPTHTFPSFEADHMGISVWRGKMNKNSGTVVLDKAAGAGTVEIVIDLASIDFGMPALNTWAKGKDFFNVKRSPRATYKGTLEKFVDGSPTQVSGTLTLNGHTQPVNLSIHRFKCVPHPMLKRELCGADATGSFNRDAFGLSAGKDYGFNMDVALRIQVEAVATQ